MRPGQATAGEWSASVRTRVAPWDEPGWTEGTLAWLGAHLTNPGPPKSRRYRPWSVVARVQSTEGVHWLKQIWSSSANEPALTSRLARHVPRRVAEVVAADERRLLTRRAGRPLSALAEQKGIAPLWEHVAPRYAELLLELVPIAAEIPVPDTRPTALALRFGERIEPVVAELGDAIPPTLVHLDIGARNVCMRCDEPVFIDWALVAFAHPLCGLTKTIKDLVRNYGAALHGAEVRRVRDAFLEPWTVYAPPRELRRMFRAAYRLGFLCRATAKQQLLDELPTFLRRRWTDKIASQVEEFESCEPPA